MSMLFDLLVRATKLRALQLIYWWICLSVCILLILDFGAEGANIQYILSRLSILSIYNNNWAPLKSMPKSRKIKIYAYKRSHR